MRKSAPDLFLTGLFLAIILSVPVIQTVADIERGNRPAVLELFTERPSAKSLRAFDESVEEESIVVRTLRPVAQAAQFLILNDAGSKALAARGGWLFYEPGISAITQRPRSGESTVDDALSAVTHFRDALRERGIRLVVVPAPNKESIYPDRVTGRAAPPTRILNPETEKFFIGCESAGVETVDLFALFREARQATTESLYLEQDSHWSPAGLQLAASAVAERIERRRPSPYVAKRRSIERHGDLIQMMRSPQIETRVSPEAISCAQIVRRETGELYSDDPASDVLVLGDSFLRIFQQDEPGSAGFIAQLAAALGRPVKSLVNDGGASTLVRQELFRRPRLLEGTKVVVWEFVERDLRLGTEGWQIVPLP
ncbi:MAG: hypothetical protein ABI680_05575 [Chthoniobacteraceae bacterium]